SKDDDDTWHFQNSGNLIGVVEGDAVKFSQDWLMRGMYHNIVGVAGTWPTDVTILAVGDTGRAPTAEPWAIKNGKLKYTGCKTDFCNSGSYYLGLFETKDALIGIEAPWSPISPTGDMK